MWASAFFHAPRCTDYCFLLLGQGSRVPGLQDLSGFECGTSAGKLATAGVAITLREEARTISLISCSEGRSMSSTTLSHGGLISLNPMNSMDPVCAYSKLRTDSLWVPRILAELRGLPLPPGLPRDAGEARPERDPARRALLEARTSLQNDTPFSASVPWGFLGP